MLPFSDWLKIIGEWIRQGQWEKVKASARKRRTALKLGSIYQSPEDPSDQGCQK
ncbi:MAG: hypothetical protein Q8P59_14175 [Dehalococcoidia bacterium]|nr:hypothetical protein [Dehalococcoidia bacterium]